MMDIIFANRLNQTELEVIECGSQKCQPNYSYGPAVRAYYYLHYIHSGQGTFRLGKQEFFLRQGEAFLITPGLITHYKADMDQPWHYSWVGFQGTKAGLYLKEAGFDENNPVIRLGNSALLCDCFVNLMCAKQIFGNNQLFLSGHLYLMLSQLIQNLPPSMSEVKEGNIQEAYVAKAIAFMKQNYATKIALIDISSHIGLDSKYLCALFKNTLKISPHRFLISVRMDKACDLMSNDALSLADISRSVGYQDPLMFSKMFKKHKGLSPREFRKTYFSNARSIQEG